MSTTARRSIAPLLLFWGFTLLLCALAWILCHGKDSDASQAALVGEMGATVPESQPAPIPCIVIDAGHGGEDGGTSSAAGLVEKEVNLSVALALRDLCEAAGIPVVMTRVEDVLLYDRNVDFHGRKKVLDLAARRIVAEKTAAQWGDCLFVSIHMNAFPQPQYSGMQVWYGIGDPRSAEVAEAIQRASTALMPANTRQIKAAGSNIYLLDRIKTPAVLVECGFLSNPPEAERLSDEGYRRALAVLIFSAIAPYLGSGS
jgi:N-acetylmuramoyl-L-alanine amidase